MVSPRLALHPISADLAEIALALPAIDPLVIPLQGSSFRFLVAKAQLLQQSGYMIAVVMNTELALNQLKRLDWLSDQ